MKTFSIRCSNTDFTYAVIDGDKSSPKVLEQAKVNFPKNFSEGEKLHWFNQEINTLIQQHSPESVVLKGAEPLAKRSKSLDERLHVESVVIMTAGANGIKNCTKKVKSTIAKDLGLKGKGKYLQTKLDTSVIDDFDSYNTKAQEAILAGWSSLN